MTRYEGFSRTQSGRSRPISGLALAVQQAEAGSADDAAGVEQGLGIQRLLDGLHQAQCDRAFALGQVGAFELPDAVLGGD